MTHLALRWSISRAKGHEGMNLVTVTDQSTGKRYSQTGSGYSLEAAALAEWLLTTHQDELRAIGARAGRVFGGGMDPERNKAADALRGMQRNRETGDILVDGIMQEIERIMVAIGLDLEQVRRETSRSSTLIGWNVVERPADKTEAAI